MLKFFMLKFFMLKFFRPTRRICRVLSAVRRVIRDRGSTVRPTTDLGIWRFVAGIRESKWRLRCCRSTTAEWIRRRRSAATPVEWIRIREWKSSAVGPARATQCLHDVSLDFFVFFQFDTCQCSSQSEKKSPYSTFFRDDTFVCFSAVVFVISFSFSAFSGFFVVLETFFEYYSVA